jgi:long-chain acyl-CoA synthetase
MRKHLATLVDDFSRHGRQVATVSYPGNRRVATTYGQLAILAGRFSRLLAERRVYPGERVVLWGANSAEWVAAFFGCVLRGVLVVPLDTAGSAEFANRVIADVSPRLVIGDPSLLQILADSVEKLWLQDAVLPAEPLLIPDASLNADTPLQILYTSGTTSAPKGIVHTHGNVLSSVDVLEREMQKYLRYERWVHPLRFLHTLPLSHVFGQFMGLWVPPLLAAEVHFEDKLVAGRLIERIRRERISVAAVVPRVLELLRVQLLADDPKLQPQLLQMQEKPAWKRWWRFRAIHRRFGLKFWAFVSGGASLPAEVEQFWSTLGFLLVEGYGMTETTALATLNHPFRTARGSVGKPLAGQEVRIAEDGEILVRGPMLAAGAWRNGRMEQRTGEWLYTGDLGSVDADGQIHFLGRKSDVIVAASGMNIYPGDLESIVRAQPGVRDCVVVGMDSPRGPEPVVVVILDEHGENLHVPTSIPGELRTPGAPVFSRILTGANRSLQEFQRIRSVLGWPGNEFPRNTMGKLLRREVAAWAQRELGAGPSPEVHAPSEDPLLRLLEQVTGESAQGLDDTSELATNVHLDSLGRMQLAMGMEEQFGIAVGDEAIGSAKTLGDLRYLIRRSQVSFPPQRRRPVAGGPAFAQSHIPPFASTRRMGHPVSTDISQSLISSLPKYPHWPWSLPVQAAREIFVECIVRPLVAMLANPRVEHAGPLPVEPSIYICNHLTVVDAALVLFALPRRVRRHMAIAMSAELLAAWQQGRVAAGVGAGPLRWLASLQARLVIALLNAFPLPADAGLRRSFAHAGEALDRGYNVLVFPEGKRSLTGELQPFQTGISLLAEESRTEVVPMALIGLRQAGEDRRIRPPGLTVVTGIPYRKGTQESHAQFTARLEAAVRHLIAKG